MGIVLESITSPEAIERNFERLNEALVAMQGGKLAMQNIVGYEDLVTTAKLNAVIQELNKLKIPVGGRYYSSVETNPAEFFGYGEWTLVGSGRVEIGVGEFTDSRQEKRSFKAGDSSGNYSHTLTIEEMPAHSHGMSEYYEKIERSSNYHRYRVTQGPRHRTMQTDKIGGGKAHSITQPYEVVYKWERTA